MNGHTQLIGKRMNRSRARLTHFVNLSRTASTPVFSKSHLHVDLSCSPTKLCNNLLLPGCVTVNLRIPRNCLLARILLDVVEVFNGPAHSG
jgi:hypothetical protein